MHWINVSIHEMALHGTNAVYARCSIIYLDANAVKMRKEIRSYGNYYQSVSQPPLSTVLSNLRATTVGTPWFNQTLRTSSHLAWCKYCRRPRLISKLSQNIEASQAVAYLMDTSTSPCTSRYGDCAKVPLLA